jgi:uncharacterized membrane protein
MTYSPSLDTDQTRTGISSGSSEATDAERPQDIAPQEQQQREQRNVSEGERWTSLAAGSILAMLGLGHRGLPGFAAVGTGGYLLYRGATGRCPLYQALDINTADANSLQARGRDLSRGVRVTIAQTINRPSEDLYAYWRDFANLPRIMSYLEEVRVLDGDGRRSHWIARAPTAGGMRFEWDAELAEDVPNERVAWRSLPGSDIDNAGVVSFEPSPRGTIVRVDMRLVAPGGRLGSWAAKMFADTPDRQIREDLRNFKRVMELGEIPTIDGQPHGTCTGQGTRSAG